MGERAFFDWAMDVIDVWKEKTPEANTGPLKNFKEIITKQIVVTHTYSISVSQLKSFLALNIMELYPTRNDSNFSYINIQNRLHGGDKKYSIDFEKLSTYLDVEKNREAFLLERQLVKQLNVQDINTEQLRKDTDLQDVWIPYLLFRDIQKMARKKLGQYYKTYMEWKEEHKNSKAEVKEQERRANEVFKKLEEIHKECVMAIALHEVFLSESLEDSIWETTAQGMQELEQLTVIIQQLKESLEHNEGNCQVQIEDILKCASQLEQKSKVVKIMPIVLEFFYEFMISLAAEQQILMMLEHSFLENMSKKVKIEKDTKEKVEKVFGKELSEMFSSNQAPGRNRTTTYVKANKYINAMFQQIKEVKIKENTANIDKLFQCSKEFLEEVAKKEKEQSQKTLWDAQLSIALWMFVNVGWL